MNRAEAKRASPRDERETFVARRIGTNVQGRAEMKHLPTHRARPPPPSLPSPMSKSTTAGPMDAGGGRNGRAAIEADEVAEKPLATCAGMVLRGDNCRCGK